MRGRRDASPKSYGYPAGPLDAVGGCRRWDWVIDLDVQAFFDSVPWDFMVKSVGGDDGPGRSPKSDTLPTQTRGREGSRTGMSGQCDFGAELHQGENEGVTKVFERFHTEEAAGSSPATPTSHTGAQQDSGSSEQNQCICAGSFAVLTVVPSRSWPGPRHSSSWGLPARRRSAAPTAIRSPSLTDASGATPWSSL
jgi:hypothetical protein